MVFIFFNDFVCNYFITIESIGQTRGKPRWTNFPNRGSTPVVLLTIQPFKHRNFTVIIVSVPWRFPEHLFRRNDLRVPIRFLVVKYFLYFKFKEKMTNSLTFFLKLNLNLCSPMPSRYFFSRRLFQSNIDVGPAKKVATVLTNLRRNWLSTVLSVVSWS